MSTNVGYYPTLSELHGAHSFLGRDLQGLPRLAQADLDLAAAQPELYELLGDLIEALRTLAQAPGQLGAQVAGGGVLLDGLDGEAGLARALLELLLLAAELGFTVGDLRQRLGLGQDLLERLALPRGALARSQISADGLPGLDGFPGHVHLHRTPLFDLDLGLAEFRDRSGNVGDVLGQVVLRTGRRIVQARIGRTDGVEAHVALIPARRGLNGQVSHERERNDGFCLDGE